MKSAVYSPDPDTPPGAFIKMLEKEAPEGLTLHPIVDKRVKEALAAAKLETAL